MWVLPRCLHRAGKYIKSGRGWIGFCFGYSIEELDTSPQNEIMEEAKCATRSKFPSLSMQRNTLQHKIDIPTMLG